ncbi:type II toxin-antitoxin system Phd/YefM family antitoxin [Sinomonas sp. G460-2]|uniref:type II toxin-antitoxin system Phd/YefM family antitoxin n=1 Tax=Sinomonas sp. G460-2 TaxID=3393464 RepID=UPI0039F005E5
MKTISQRELRNDNAEVMRGVEAGETYTVTRRGVPIATISPLVDTSDMHCLRPARKHPTYSLQKRAVSGIPTRATLDEIRGER